MVELKKENYKSDEACVACGLFGEGMTCLHHLNSRGAGGQDEDFNLISTCFLCHINYHQKGLLFMANKYPRVSQWLEKQNWYICELTGKYHHEK